MTLSDANDPMTKAALAFEGKEHYCLKCKQKRIMTAVTLLWCKNGVPAARGTCQTCGAGMNRTLPRNPAQ